MARPIMCRKQVNEKQINIKRTHRIPTAKCEPRFFCYVGKFLFFIIDLCSICILKLVLILFAHKDYQLFCVNLTCK